MDVRLGGALGYGVLAALTKCVGAVTFEDAGYDPYEHSRFRQYFQGSLERELGNRVVLDFGCGRGADAVVAALAGAAHVYGVDINEPHLEIARRMARERGVADRCTFINAADVAAYRALAGTIDVVISVDAFEHFGDPAAILAEIRRLLTPTGTLLLSFGPPWKHPYGAHMNHFNRMPWIHFLFTEKTILAVRKTYLDDGARRFEDVTGGLNRMTVDRFERVVREGGFVFDDFEAVPIKGLRALAKNRLTREYFTSIVRARLLKAG